MNSKIGRFLICCVLAAVVCFGLLKFGPGRSSGIASAPTASAAPSSGFNPSGAVQKLEADARQQVEEHAPVLTMQSGNQVGDALGGKH